MLPVTSVHLPRQRRIFHAPFQPASMLTMTRKILHFVQDNGISSRCRDLGIARHQHEHVTPAIATKQVARTIACEARGGDSAALLYETWTGVPVVSAGLLLAPISLTKKVLSPISGALSDRIGSRLPATDVSGVTLDQGRKSQHAGSPAARGAARPAG